MPPVDDAIETEDQPQTAETAAAEEAAFVQSFGGTPTEETPPAAEEDEDGTAQNEPASSEGQTPAMTAEQYETALAKMAEIDGLKSAVEKLQSTAFGRLGGLERTLRELQATTPAGQAISVTKDDFAEMAKEYPDLVDFTVTGFNRVLSKVKGTGEFDPKAFEQKVTERVTQETQQIKLDLMDSVREDWREVVNSEPYKQWLATQPAEYQTQVLDSWSPRTVLGSIKSFETATTPPVTPAAPDPTPPTRSRRLAAAVAPKSAGGTGSPTAKTEDDYFNEGFTTGRVTR